VTAEDASSDETPVDAVRPQRRWPKRLIRAAALAFALGCVYYLVSLVQVWSTGNDDEARPVDAIVVLGAAQYDGRPSPQLAARLDHAFALFGLGDSARIVVTGAKRSGDRFTEAQASAMYLESKGVPSSAIVVVGIGHTTYESMVAVRAELTHLRLKSVLIVTDPYHTLRSELIAEDLGLTAFVSPTRTSPVRGSTAFGRELGEAGGVAVGRIIGFRRLDAIVH
jgi:uncharacterized SAM-binding protein YcdF (DUF218 family)